MNKDMEYIKARRGKGKTSHIIEKYYSQQIETMTIANALWYHWKTTPTTSNAIDSPSDENSTPVDRFRAELEKIIKTHGEPTLDGYKIRFSILGGILKTNQTFQELRKGNGKARETMIKLYGNSLTFKEEGATDWMYWHHKSQATDDNSDNSKTVDKDENQKEVSSSPPSEALSLHTRAEDIQRIMDGITVEQAIKVYYAVREYGMIWSENEKVIINCLLQGMIPTNDFSSIIEKLLMLRKITDDEAVNNKATKELLDKVPVDKLLSLTKKKIDDFSLTEMSIQLNMMMDDVCSAIKETMPFIMSSPEVVGFYELINQKSNDMGGGLLTLHRCYKKIRTMSMWLNADCDWSTTDTDTDVFGSFGLTTPFMYNGLRNYWDKDNQHLKDFLIHEKKYLEVYEWRSGYKKDSNQVVETKAEEDQKSEFQSTAYSEREGLDQIECNEPVQNRNVLHNTMDGDGDKGDTEVNKDEIDALEDLLSF